MYMMFCLDAYVGLLYQLNSAGGGTASYWGVKTRKKAGEGRVTIRGLVIYCLNNSRTER
jgi:hypothetical protein